MVERVNGTITQRCDQSTKEMTDDLVKFIVYYIFYRRHGSLRKELNVIRQLTDDALEKWFEIYPIGYWLIYIK